MIALRRLSSRESLWVVPACFWLLLAAAPAPSRAGCVLPQVNADAAASGRAHYAYLDLIQGRHKPSDLDPLPPDAPSPCALGLCDAKGPPAPAPVSTTPTIRLDLLSTQAADAQITEAGGNTLPLVDELPARDDHRPALDRPPRLAS